MDGVAPSFMSALREGGDRGGSEPMAGPFAKTEVLGAVRCGCLSCSSDAKVNGPSADSSVVEARFGPSSNFESTCEDIESVSHFSKDPEGLVDVLWISIGRCVREVRARLFFERECLVGVTLGASSMVERICAGAFCRTSIESLYIPDSVVELGETCFHGCESLGSVLFGASSKLERICAGAFSETSIESLSIPDGVVDLT